MLTEHHKAKKARSSIRIGPGPGQISVAELEGRINGGIVRVIVLRDERGKRRVSPEGQTMYTFRFATVDLSGYMIVKDGSQYRVRKEPDSQSGSFRELHENLLDRAATGPG